MSTSMRDLVIGEAELDDEEDDESFDEATGEARDRQRNRGQELEDSSEEDEDDDDEEEAQKVRFKCALAFALESVVTWLMIRLVTDSRRLHCRRRGRG